MKSGSIPLSLLRSLRGTGQTLTVAADGTSMLPLIRSGDRIDVRFDPVDAFRRGDILLFERGRGLVLHRVVHRTVRDGSILFMEKGDDHLLASPLPAEAALARVVRVRRGERVFDLESRPGRWVRRWLLGGATLDASLPALRRLVLGDRPTRIAARWRRLGRSVRGALIRMAWGFRLTK